MSHSRFDAISRQYNYFIHDEKNPFSQEYSYFYPYRRDIDVLNQLAGRIQMEDSFESFCKKNTQVHTYKCYILESRWSLSENGLMYQVKANRFLRGIDVYKRQTLYRSFLPLQYTSMAIGNLKTLSVFCVCSIITLALPGSS